MKNGIRALFILSFFVLVFIFSSCATAGKKQDPNFTPEKKSESYISEKNKSIESKKEDRKIIVVPSIQKPAIKPVKKPKINESNQVTGSVNSVSDPKPLSDKPELELIVVTEDQEDPVMPDLSVSEDQISDKPETPSPRVSSKITTSTSKPQISNPPPKLDNSNVKENLSDIVVLNEKDTKKSEILSGDKIAGLPPITEELPNKEKVPESETTQIFSEFPSTEPYESTDEKTSRSVKLYTGQRLEVLYPGEGWVYLGESTAQRGIKYQQRKLQNGTSIFHFVATDEGSYILNFSYFDVFSDNFISDSIAVYVEKAKTKLTDIVRAPDYKGSINTSKFKSDGSGSENHNHTSSSSLEGTPIKKEAPHVKNESPGSKLYDSSDLLTVTGDEKKQAVTKIDTKSASEALDKIRGYISEGNVAEALNSADNFFKNYSVNLDEALFLRGQAYELNGPNKNVKKALDAYQTLIKAYPESRFWDKADARIRYIKKFYIDIK